MKKLVAPFLLLVITLTACDTTDYVTTPPPPAINRKILVDASKDGGVWWFPQAGPVYSNTADHQGRDLALYLRSLGFIVDELPRDAVITSGLLSQYRYIIRAGGFGQYTQDELSAYDAFLNRGSSLLLLQDHLQNFTNDQLSSRLGVDFEGSIGGTMIQFAPHPVTAGTLILPYDAGSFISNPNPANMTVLGWVNAKAVMGVVNHPSARIFFIGDMNGIETLPQPFTEKLFSWLFY